MLIKKIFNDNFENFEIATICMENHASHTNLSHTNASNFRRPLLSLLLRYTAENSQIT